MRSDAVAGAEVLHRTDGMTVLGQETIAHFVYPFGVAGGKPLLEHLDAMPTEEDQLLAFGCQPLVEVINTRYLFVQTMDEPFGDGCRRLERLMGNEVEDSYVACVSDAGEDRNLELCTDRAEGVVVEAGEVGRSTAASYDDNGVVRTAFG